MSVGLPRNTKRKVYNMKTRTGFVSNSSSSSFIVINAKTGHNFPNWDSHLIVDSSFGETEFGWGPETITGIGSRVIFAYFQAKYDNNDKWIKMLENCITSNTDVETIEWKVNIDDWDSEDHGYIDHASCACEGENTEMFGGPALLRDFIFGKGSKIVLDNDNG